MVKRLNPNFCYKVAMVRFVLQFHIGFSRSFKQMSEGKKNSLLVCVISKILYVFWVKERENSKWKKSLCQHKMFNNKPSGKLHVGMDCCRNLFLISYLYGIHTAWSPVITELVIK